MKNAPLTLAFLQTNNAFTVADLYTITLRSGTVLRFTAYDADLTVGGQTFLAVPKAPVIIRDTLRNSRGLEVAEVKVTLGVNSDLKLGARSLALAAAEGVLDGAAVLIQRLVMPSPGDVSLDVMWWFEGAVGTAEVQTTKIVLPVRCLRERLSTVWPRRSYMPNCPYVYGEKGPLGLGPCYQEPPFSTGVVAAGSTTTIINVDFQLGRGVITRGEFNFGTIIFTSGECTGVARTLVASENTAVTVAVALPRAPAPGDGFILRAGCDGTIDNCARHNNLSRYGGFPTVPKPETVR